MLLGHIKHFCLSNICLLMALCPILRLCIHVCMYSCQPEGRFDPQSFSKKQGQIGVKVPFLRSMIPYIAHILFWLVCIASDLTALLFSKLNKQGLLGEFHAHRFNGYVVYQCDLFATFLLAKMMWAVIQSRYLWQAWDKIYSRNHMQSLVWSNF